MDTLPKVRDSSENFILLASSRGRSFVGIGPFGMSEHSRQFYWSQFVHFSWFYRPGIPSSYPNPRIHAEEFGKFPKNPGSAMCTTPLMHLSDVN